MLKRMIFALMLPVCVHASKTSYYDQFMFEVMGDCRNQSTVWFKAVASWRPESVPPTPGKRVYPSLKLQIFKNNTYWGQYAEERVERLPSGQIRSEKMFETNVRGRWSIAGEKITFSNLGYGIPHTYSLGSETYPSFALTVTGELSESGGTVFNMAKVVTDVGPLGQSIREFCNW